MQQKSIVLVHGGFVDGSGWLGVHKILTGAEYEVLVVQNPTVSLTDDAAFARRAINSARNDVILVGHSYGGAVITEAGTDPKVSALVYISAFAPDRGESVSGLLAHPAPGAPVPPILPPKDGFLMLDKAKFAASFAADVDPQVATFMADSQVPWGLEALNGTISNPAWKIKPSWYFLTTEDQMIPPPVQSFMAKRANATIVETPGSHATYVANPTAVANIILEAARASEATAVRS